MHDSKPPVASAQRRRCRRLETGRQDPQASPRATGQSHRRTTHTRAVRHSPVISRQLDRAPSKTANHGYPQRDQRATATSGCQTRPLRASAALPVTTIPPVLTNRHQTPSVSELTLSSGDAEHSHHQAHQGRRPHPRRSSYRRDDRGNQPTVRLISP
jgi:hypothetical protein